MNHGAEGSGTQSGPHPAIPLSRRAGRQLAELARVTGASAIARLSGADLLGERASLNRFRVPCRQSAGGGCHLLAAQNGWIALNLSRPDDCTMLPALVQADEDRLMDDAAIARHIAGKCAARLVARGREMGLAIAAVDEAAPPPPAVTAVAHGPERGGTRHRPLVIDFSALWAGPLASHLLWLAGADVVKVESAARPDAMRGGDPALFARLAQGKASVTADFTCAEDRAVLLGLIERADIVIEASRPRALKQWGIDADALVAQHPGLVWLSITGHGISGEAADWVGFGDDCGVAAGLTAALARTTGAVGFVGDAIADPLTGIAAALAGLRQWQSGQAARLAVAMRGVAAQALAEETAFDADRLAQELVGWAAAAGQPFPDTGTRAVTAEVRAPGADNARWLRC